MSSTEKTGNEKKEPKSFWETLPGIMTAIATLVTAVSGCIATVILTWPRPNILFPDTPKPIVITLTPIPPVVATLQMLPVETTPILPVTAISSTPLPQLRIVSSGQEILNGSYAIDLDTGQILGADNATDIFWEIQDDTVRHLDPWGGAQFSYLGIVNFDQVSAPDFLTADYTVSKINGSNNLANQLMDGTVILVRTNSNNFCKLIIVKYGVASPGDLPEWPKESLLISWVTYSIE